MTELQAVKAGFVMFQDGHGWWAGDGERQAGPCRSKVKLLGAIDCLLNPDEIHLSCSVCGEADGCEHLVVEDDGAVAQAMQLNVVMGPAEAEPILCVGCHKLFDAGAVKFNRRGRCPGCGPADRD